MTAATTTRAGHGGVDCFVGLLLAATQPKGNGSDREEQSQEQPEVGDDHEAEARDGH